MRFFLKHRLWYGMVSILVVLLLGLLLNEKNWRPLKNYAEWQASANFNTEYAQFAIDRKLKTAWSSGAPMLSGMFFQVDLGRSQRVNGLVFRGEKTPDQPPAEWILSVSQDGISWQKITPQRAFTYKTLFVVTFRPASARYLQIVQSSAQTSSQPWDIHEIEVLQPILPWQTSRATLLRWLVAWAIVAAILLMYGREEWQTPGQIVLVVVMLIAALTGWWLRVADLTVGELSVQEMRELSLVDFGKDPHLHWIKSYYDNTQTGQAWLHLLLKRLCYDLFKEPFIALRIVSALWSVAVVILFPAIWRRMTRAASVAAIWEGVLSASALSVACFAVWTSRQGDVSGPFLGVWLLIVWMALRWMDRQRSYGSLILLALFLAGGYLLDPAMRYVSISLLLSGGATTALAILRTHDSRWSSIRAQIGRLGGIVLAALPLWGYVWWLEPHGTAPAESLLWPARVQLVAAEAAQVWQLSGVSGLPGLVLLGLVLRGVVRLVKQRNRGTWFFFVQGILFNLLAWGRTTPLASAPLLILLLLIIILGVNGLLALFELIHRRYASLSPGHLQVIAIGAIVICFGYLTGFSLNSLFLGASWFPYAPVVRETYRQGKNVNTVLAALQAEEGKCAAVGTLDRMVADRYPDLYAIHPALLALDNAERLAKLGRFTSYLLAAKEALIPAEQHFVHQYYTEIGGGRSITVYRLRSEWERTAQRYTPADLQYDTGRHLNDAQSASGVVRVATPDDPPGRLASWPPFRVCQPGDYLARYALHSEGNTAEIVVVLEVLDETHQALARRVVRGTDFVNPDAYQRFDLPCQVTFDNPAFPLRRLLLLVSVTGAAEVRLDYLELVRQAASE